MSLHHLLSALVAVSATVTYLIAVCGGGKVKQKSKKSKSCTTSGPSSDDMKKEAKPKRKAKGEKSANKKDLWEGTHDESHSAEEDNDNAPRVKSRTMPADEGGTRKVNAARKKGSNLEPLPHNVILRRRKTSSLALAQQQQSRKTSEKKAVEPPIEPSDKSDPKAEVKKEEKKDEEGRDPESIKLSMMLEASGRERMNSQAAEMAGGKAGAIGLPPVQKDQGSDGMKSSAAAAELDSDQKNMPAGLEPNGAPPPPSAARPGGARGAKGARPPTPKGKAGPGKKKKKAPQ